MTRRAIPRDPSGQAADVTLASGEIVWDQLASALRLGDGVTPGGKVTVATDLSNVTAFDTSRVAQAGSAYTVSANWPRMTTSGVGQAVTDRHWHYSRINMDLSTPYGPGTSWGGFSVSANIGGTGLNTVPELISAYAIYDTPSPNAGNPNIVPVQGRSIVSCDGRVAGGALMSNFALAGFCGGSPTGQYYNQCGLELDVGSNFAASSTGIAATRDAHLGGRSGISLVSIGIQKGDVNSDGAVVIASGPQYAGGYQVNYPGLAGWRAGILFSNALGATGFNEPISSDGAMIATKGTWACAKGVDFSGGVQFSGPAIDLPLTTNGSGGIRFGGDAGIYRDSANGLVFPNRVGFGKASVSPTTLPAAATDLASAITLVNALRTLMINVGLGQ